MGVCGGEFGKEWNKREKRSKNEHFLIGKMFNLNKLFAYGGVRNVLMTG